MIPIQKKFFAGVIFLFVATFTLFSPTFANAGGSIVDIRESPGTIEIDFVIDDPAPTQIDGVEVRIAGGAGVTCTHSFDYNKSDGTSDFGKTITANCPMGSVNQGTYPVEVWHVIGNWLTADILVASTNFNYTGGTPSTASGKFVGEPVRNANGSYTFNVQLGIAAVGVNSWADLALVNSGILPPWDPNAGYTCAPGEIAFDWVYVKDVAITCTFTNIPSGGYTMGLYDSRVAATGNQLDTVQFFISNMDLKTPTAIGSPTSPNRFNIPVVRYANSAPVTFSLKVRDPSTNAISNAVVHTQSYNGIGTSTFSNVDFNNLPPGTYKLVLVDTSNDAIQDEDTITIADNVLKDTCTCRTLATVNTCTPTPAMEVVRNSCYAGKTYTLTCQNPTVLGGGASCSCACGGTSTIRPGGPIVVDFTTDDLGDLFKSIQNVIIAIAVVSGVFIIPYAFILMASGNPEKIKQGTDWLKSIFWGYLVIFLAGFLIRTVGGEVLSLGL